MPVVVGILVAWTTGTGLLGGFGVGVSPIWVDFLFVGFALAGGGWVTDLLNKLMQSRVNGNGTVGH